MKKINYIFITVCLLSLISLAQANIVDELTRLNNLYKEGALNQDEFDKAKKIILKTDSEENSEIEPKQIIEIKKPKNKTKNTKDLTKTFIDKEELEIIGRYEEINNYPERLFKNPKLSSIMLADKATQEMYKTFVQNKNLQEKYPENMMKAMAYFEVFYNRKLKDEKLAIQDYQENFPNVKKSSKKSIQSLYSLTQAKKSMRESVGLTLNEGIEEALIKYMHMHDFLVQGTKSKNKLTTTEKKLKRESTNFKKYIGSFRKNLELKSEQRIDEKEFNKQLKINTKKINKVLKKLNKIDSGKYQIYETANDIFTKSLNIIDNCNNSCDRKQLLTVIDSIDFTNAILKDFESDIVKKLYVNDLSNIKIGSFSEKQKETLILASISSKRKNEIKKYNLQNSVLNLANNNFEIDKILSTVESQGYEVQSIKMSFDKLDKMEDWNVKDWANSWRGDLPSNEFKDKSGNLIQLSSDNIEDLKAQLARNEFQDMIDLKDIDIGKDLNDNLNDIAKSVQDNSGFNLNNWLNQSFSITLDNYTKIAAESIISELGSSINQDTINDIRKNANFENLTKLVNLEYGSNMSAEDYANYWQNSTVDGSTSNWGDITAGVDLISQVGSFEAASIAKDLGTDLQTVADSIALAASVGVSSDLEAAAQGLGYSSFSEAVSAYNEQYGTNYTDEEARESLGQ
ncbi:SHOCT domain-containing protein [Candidatus Pelagibacter sp. Uisw_094]|uniref:SHOCT domain-containing protein n=1 Tax=Candidatus Pelagibacter sp. Uisw_094 TaxID=3230980 RepID=UPI0039EA22AD